jgi:hypothetical protein
MKWLESRSDLCFMQEFRNKVFRLLEIEGRAATAFEGGFYMLPHERQAHIQTLAYKIAPEYPQVREEVARDVVRAIRIARRYGVPVDGKSAPPPAVGGIVVPVNLFYAVLGDNSYGGIPGQAVVDTLNQALGVLEERCRREFLRLLNPVNWLWGVLTVVLRIPFKLVEATGFDAGKVEDHLLGKVFKLVELTAILYVVAKLGIGQDMKDLLVKLVTTK